jgi:hypothetical protein
MPALTPTDVENYTQGRLNRDDPETARLLAAASRGARRRCGWHVTPVIVDHVVVINGPGSGLLVLPTLRLGALTEVTEDGVTVPIAELDISPEGMVEKKSGQWWTRRLGGITVKMTHGFEAAEDFDAAVLSLIDRMSAGSAGGRARVIGPFQYDIDAVASGSAFSDIENGFLEQYELEAPA